LPQVDFHSGVREPVHFACRLLRKAWRQGVAVLVTAPPATLSTLDRELWTFEAHEFVPHLRVRAGQAVDAAARRTPIWLCEGQPPSPCPKVLVNLGADVADSAAPFERIIEIVPGDGDERDRARARWRAYEARGWVLQHHRQPAG
jgi:DNA polymerase-3 subunit chi